MVSRIQWFVFALSLVFSGLAGAGPLPAEQRSAWAESDHARARLIAGGYFDHQGRKIYAAALEIRLDDGWKTYWRSPGEGLPPSFDWKNSKNIAYIKVLWPAPMRLDEPGGLVSAGYMGRVILPVHIVPEDAAEAVRLRVSVMYGACREICIPVEAELALDLDLSEMGKASRDIEAALNAVPKPQTAPEDCPHRFVRAAISVDKGKPSLKIVTETHSEEGIAFFAEPPDGLFLPTPILEKGHFQNGERIYRIDMDDGSALQELEGKELRFTMVSALGSCESIWRME